MSAEFKDKVAVITGGSRGIGYGIAQALLAEGAKVFICGRDERHLKAALESLGKGAEQRVGGMVADVRVYENCRKLIQTAAERFGGLDILVNNAGTSHTYRPVDQISPEDWDTVISTNLSGAFYCCREAIPFMRKQGGGYIFNISSTAVLVLYPGGSGYNASKSGLSGFTETVVKDLRYEGIRVTEIITGSVSVESRGFEPWKLAVEDITKIVTDLYKFPARALVSRIEILPSQAPPNR